MSSSATYPGGSRGVRGRVAMVVRLGIIVALFPKLSLAQDVVYRGIYTHDHEVHSFEPCGSGTVYWVSGTPYVLNDLTEFLETSREQPYQPVFLAFRGHPHIEAVDGFAADYAGVVHISELIAWQRAVDQVCGEEMLQLKPSPIVGVERVIARSDSNYEVHSIRGIGSVQLYRAPWSRLTIDFAHETGDEFTDLEGISITDVNSRQKLSLEGLARSGEFLLLGTRLMIMPREEPINWRIDFVDYYR